MIRKIINWMYRKKTKNYTQIPLAVINFNYRAYKNPLYHGRYNCNIHIHPSMNEDTELVDMLKKCVDHIRSNYDMEIFVRAFDEK